jgi:hypothetical protein
MRSRPARYVGSLLDKFVRYRRIVKYGSNASPPRTASFAWSSLPSRGNAEARRKCPSGYAVGLDTATQPHGCVFIGVQQQLGMTDEQNPSQGENIPRRKPRLSDMALVFCWPTQIAFGETDPSVSGSQIAVQSQRLFAFSAALSCTVRCNLDQAQHGVGERVVRSHRERPGHKRLGRRKASRTVIAGVGGAYRCIHECDAAIKDLAFKRREAGRAFQRAGKRKVVIGIRKSAGSLPKNTND